MERVLKMDSSIKKTGESEMWSNWERYLSLLKAENKLTRRKTLQSIHDELQTLIREKIVRKTPGPDGDGGVSVNVDMKSLSLLDEDDTSEEKDGVDKEQLEILISYIRSLIMMISDPVEKCREITYETFTLIAEIILSPTTFVQFLPQIVPILLERLGQQELNESSEEVRLLAVKFMQVVVDKMDSYLGPFVDDFLQILSVTLTDPFHFVRLVSCKVTSKLAKSLPHIFHYNSERLIQPLCKTITHQQFRVRVATVECIRDTIIFGNHKSVEQFVPSVTMRLFDPSPNVRSAVIQLIGKWMTEFIDRYSHFQRFIPIILTALCDESPDVSQLAEETWSQIGNKYLDENAEDYKDQLDFPIPKPSHYPKGVKRPNLGCRILTWRHVCNIIPGVTNDITDWVDGNRQKSAQLMYHYILNSENKIIMHCQKLIECMYRACLDKDPLVIDYVLKSANLLGFFVPLTTSWPLLSSGLAMGTHEGSLANTTAILQGSSQDSLNSYCKEITDLISTREICETLNSKRQLWILKIVRAFIEMIPEKSAFEDISYNLFVILISLMAMSNVVSIQKESADLMNMLKDVSGMSELDELFVQHCGHILQKIKETSSEWTPLTPNKLIFSIILSQGGAVVEHNMNVILDILVDNLHPEKDPEVRLKFFMLLSQVLSKYNLTIWADEAKIKNMQVFVMSVIESVLSPSLVWKAGKTASALRTSALACLLSVLEGELADAELLLPGLSKLFPTCLGLIDDSNYMNRLVACQCLGLLATRCPKKIPPELVHNSYMELLKRMDDENDHVRISACLTISKLFLNVPEDYDAKFFKVHLEYVYRSLLLYLDDDDESIQTCVYDVLKQLWEIKPDTFMDECNKLKNKLRNTDQCQCLMNEISTSLMSRRKEDSTD